MAPTTFSMKSFFERINDVDPDLRQMALFDLHQECLKDSFVLQEEDKVMKHIIKCFSPKESNSEVHCNVLRILTVMVPRLEQRSRDALVDHLARMMHEPIADAPPERIRATRDNSGMALKAIAECLPEKSWDTADKCVRLLLAGLSNKDPKIRTEILEVAAEFCRRFGDKLTAHHQGLQEGAMKDFSGDASLRKRAIACVAVLANYTANDLFSSLMDHTVNGLSKDKGERLRINIQLCSAISRAAGGRFAGYVAKVVPLLVKELKRLDGADEEERESPEADETRENILQAFENFCTRCPGSLSALLDDIVTQCAELLRWDPNFCGDFDDEDNDDDEEMFDEDTSWKVRKSAARCLSQAIKSRSDMLSLFIQRLLKAKVSSSSGATVPLLVTCFYERVETVRLDALDVFRSMLVVKRPLEEGQSDDRSPGSGSFSQGSFQIQEQVATELQELLPVKDDAVHALVVAAKHKSPKVKLCIFQILREVFSLIGAELTNAVGECVGATIDCLKNPKLALPHLRPDVLQFARTLVARSVQLAQRDENPAVIAEAEKLFPVIFSCSEDRYFKTVVVALRVCGELVPVTMLTTNQDKAAKALFDCLFTHICTAGAEPEVKRAAIGAMAALLQKQEGVLTKSGAELEKTYAQLVTLLQNEPTRIAGAHAVRMVQNCHLKPDVVKRFTTELTDHLRKNDRQVREAALRTLTSFVDVHLRTLDENTLTSIISELTSDNTSLLTDKELYLTSLALKLSRSIANAPKQSKNIAKTVAPRVLKLVSSPLVQGQVINDASDLFRALVVSSDVNINDLINEVQTAAKQSNASNISNVAVIVGATVANDQDANRRNKAISEYCAMAKPQSASESVGLVCLGEVGRHVDIASVKGASETLQGALSSSSSGEEVRMCAAFALGRAASSEQGKTTLSKLIADVAGRTGHKYFALRALKEALVAMVHDNKTTSGFAENKEKLTNLFLEYGEDEHAADVAAEAIGRCSQLDATLIAKFAKSIGAAGAGQQACILAGLRFAVTGSRRVQVDDAVKNNLEKFLAFLTKSFPVHVRRAAVQLLTALAYARPALLLHPFVKATVFGALLEETAVDSSMIEMVDLGPFKHIVDKGLELRKLSVEGLATFVDGAGRSNSVLDFVGNYQGVVERMAASLHNPPEHDLEINAAARTILSKLSKQTVASGALLASLDQIATTLKTTSAMKPKDGQEAEKIVEANKQSIVCALRLSQVAGAMQNAKFQDLMATVQKSAHYEAARTIAMTE